MLGLRLGLVIPSKVGGGCLLTGNPKIIATITSGNWGGLGVGVHILDPTTYSLPGSAEEWSLYYASYENLHIGAVSGVLSHVVWYTGTSISFGLYQKTNTVGVTTFVKDGLFFTNIILNNATMSIERACNWASNP